MFIGPMNPMNLEESDTPTPEVAEAAPPPEPPQQQAMPLESQDLPSPESFNSGAPHWAVFGPDFRFPPNKQVFFLRIPSDWTDNPSVGREMTDEKGAVMMKPGTEIPRKWRQCIVWSLNVADKRAALQRSLGDDDRAIEECCRQMLRSIDGVRVDWGVAGVQDTFWNEIGERNRRLLKTLYHRLHALTQEQMTYFLADCVAARSTG